MALYRAVESRPVMAAGMMTRECVGRNIIRAVAAAAVRDAAAGRRRDEIMPREHGGDSTPEGSSIPARLNQSDIVFIFSIRLEPTKTLQGSG
jgi:hypothetical protein